MVSFSQGINAKLSLWAPDVLSNKKYLKRLFDACFLIYQAEQNLTSHYIRYLLSETVKTVSGAAHSTDIVY